VSRLRARCPACGTFTAVALGPDYECHSCGREFHAGMVRVPRAWGDGGDAMIEAASLPLPYPEAGVIEESSLRDQNLVLASELPERPLVLGGCCCSHVGAVEGLATRHDRLAVVWLDAHGDLNTPETSPSGNEWGMPLRLLIDGGAVAADDVALVGARNLDPPEEEFIASTGVHVGPDAVDRALEDVDCVYVALDVDVFRPGELAMFMPEPDGPRVGEIERLFAGLRRSATILGAGFTGLEPDPENVPKLTRLAGALGL
jgi:arginase